MYLGVKDARQRLAVSPNPLQHHPALKLQDGRQEDIIVGVRQRTVISRQHHPVLSYKKRDKRRVPWETRTGDKLQEGQHHPSLKLQEGRQKDSAMADKDW